MTTTLKQVRQALNMTQVEAAEFLGVSRRSYQSYENENNRHHSIKYQYMYEKLRSFLTDEDKRILSIYEIKSGCESVFSEHDVDYCYLFGSYAKGKAREDSDVDLLISTSITGLKFFGLMEALRETMHKKVNVLDVGQLENNMELLHDILKDGVKIYG